VQTLFFLYFEWNIGPLFEISNQIEQLCHTQVTISKYLLSSFNSFVAPCLLQASCCILAVLGGSQWPNIKTSRTVKSQDLS